MKIVWENVNGTITLELIEEVQNMLSIQFPQKFIECSLNYHSGKPVPSHFRTVTGGIFSIYRLLSFKQEEDWYIGDEISRNRDYLPNGIIPFAVDVSLCLICFDFHENKTEPKVVLMKDEMAPEISEVGEEEARRLGFVEISPSFHEFLDSLFEYVYIEEEEI